MASKFSCLRRGGTITVTSGLTIEPLGNLQPITADGAVSTSASTAIGDGSRRSYGDLLVLLNVGSNAITIKNSANTLLGGDVVLGANDTLLVIWDGDNWVRLATGDN